MDWVYIEKNGSSYDVKTGDTLPAGAINAKLTNSATQKFLDHTRKANGGSLNSTNLSNLTHAMDIAHIAILAGI